MNDYLRSRGINPDRFHWTEIVACKGLDVSLFFESYETDQTLAAQIDLLCLDCPVQKECYQAAEKNNDQGLFGGFYFKGGSPDTEKNKHKTKSIVLQMTRKIYADDSIAES